MPLVYRDPLMDAQLLRTVGHSCYGGADLAECLATARGIHGIVGWFAAWMTLGDRVRADAGYSLRASNYYRNAYIFLFGEPLGRQITTGLRSA